MHPPYVYEPESPTPEIVGPPIVPDELVEAWYPKIRFAPKEYPQLLRTSVHLLMLPAL